MLRLPYRLLSGCLSWQEGVKHVAGSFRAYPSDRFAACNFFSLGAVK
jgi:hypothetical protein